MLELFINHSALGVTPGLQEIPEPPQFQGFRLLLEKAEDFDELKIYVETLAFKLLGPFGWVPKAKIVKSQAKYAPTKGPKIDPN